MKGNKFFWLSVASLLIFVPLSFYLDEVLHCLASFFYSDDSIPLEYKKDVYYFYDAKRRFKMMATIAYLFLLTYLFLYLWVNSTHVSAKVILVLKCVLVVTAFLLSIKIGIFVT